MMRKWWCCFRIWENEYSLQFYYKLLFHFK